ncbi:hypothetical protein ABFT80_23540 [Mesorhizobium sp. SB112]|uniref:hypothetical protein n=1 Tax=Mesorhizobium sp. SB112 TaxID=3151853 RepID=UPI0032636E1D
MIKITSIIADGHRRVAARLGISIPLPSLDYSQSIPLPFGRLLTSTLALAICPLGSGGDATNCTGSMPASAISASPTARFVRRQNSIERQTFYAGRSAIMTNFNMLMVGKKWIGHRPMPIRAWRIRATDVELLGRIVRLCLRAVHDPFQPLVPDVKQNLGRAFLRKPLRAIPKRL